MLMQVLERDVVVTRLRVSGECLPPSTSHLHCTLSAKPQPLLLFLPNNNNNNNTGAPNSSSGCRIKHHSKGGVHHTCSNKAATKAGRSSNVSKTKAGVTPT